MDRATAEAVSASRATTLRAHRRSPTMSAAGGASALAAVEAELSCPLCMRVFFDPLALPCGHTIDRACLRRALQLHAHCPLCRAPLSTDEHIELGIAYLERRADVDLVKWREVV